MVVMITADHGNLEVMSDKTTGQPHTAHTTDPVPFILSDNRRGSATAAALPTSRRRSSRSWHRAAEGNDRDEPHRLTTAHREP